MTKKQETKESKQTKKVKPNSKGGFGKLDKIRKDDGVSLSEYNLFYHNGKGNGKGNECGIFQQINKI